MKEALHERLAFRLPLFLMIGFAAAALFLATLGVYGVLSHSVSERTCEIGLRLALGGTPGSITALTLRRGLTVVGTGLAAGAAAALDSPGSSSASSTRYTRTIRASSPR